MRHTVMKRLSSLFCTVAIAGPSLADLPSDQPQGISLLPLARRDDSGPWAYPEHIYNAGQSYDKDIPNYVPFPGCTQYASGGDISSQIDSCSSSRCTEHFGAICESHTDLVDKTCFCNNFDVSPYFKTCGRSSIGGRQLYKWLDALCNTGDVTWTNRPVNWDKVTTGTMALAYLSGDIHQKAPSCMQDETLDVHKESFQTAWNICQFNATGFEGIIGGEPKFSAEDGTWLDTDCFCASLNKIPNGCSSALDKTKQLLWWNAACGNKTIIFPSDWKDSLVVSNKSYISTIAEPECMEDSSSCNNTLNLIKSEYASDRCIVDSSGFCSSDSTFLKRSSFCSAASYKTTCEDTCTSKLDPTRKLLWWDFNCGEDDLPLHWKDELVLQNSSYLSNIVLPTCLSSQEACNTNLTRLMSSCTSERCILDSNRQCSSSANFVSQHCLCNPLVYGVACPGTCPGACEGMSRRHDFLSFLNATCGNMTGWTGLPDDWEDLMGFSVDEVIPWSWRVQPDTCLNGHAIASKCPSNAAKLGTFAAANAAMLIAVPIIGRRIAMSKLTFGLLGHADSKFWVTSALVVVALQLTSNIINALLVHATPGFSHVPVWDLMLLWCTRPRVAWFSVFLINVQASQAMYFSVAASSLLAELILQLISLYYMSRVANFGASHGFYKGELNGAPGGSHALTMYAGAIIWLTIIVFALTAVAWSAFNVNMIIAEVGHEVVEVKLRNMGKVRTAKKFASEAREAQSGAVKLQRRIVARMHDLLAEADQGGVPVNGPPRNPEARLIGPARVEHNAWRELLNNCGTLAGFWAEIERQILQIPLDTNAELAFLKQSLGVKDLWAAKKRLDGLGISMDALREEEANEAAEWHAQERYNTLRIAIATYKNRYRAVLDARLAASMGTHDNVEAWRRRVPRPNQLPRIARPEGWDVEKIWQDRLQDGLSDLWRRLRRRPEPPSRLNLVDSWSQVSESWQDLVISWDRVSASWQNEIQVLDRATTEQHRHRQRSTSEEATGRRYVLESLRKQQVRSRLSSVPRIVFLGMVLCWVAQWCFWAGFIELAGDRYCPPKLGAIAGVWIGFSITGAGVGASL